MFRSAHSCDSPAVAIAGSVDLLEGVVAMAAFVMVAPAPREGLIGLVAENLTQVGDRGRRFRGMIRRERCCGKPTDGRGGFVVSEPVEIVGEHGQWAGAANE